MKSKNAIASAALSLSALALGGCLFGNSSDGDESRLGETVQANPYTVIAGNRIVTPIHHDTGYYCENGVIASEDYENGPDTVEFAISGNSMTLYTFKDTTGSGAIVQMNTLCSRVGSGSGLEGTWKLDSQGYRVLSGTLTAKEKAEYDEDASGNGFPGAHTKIYAQFAGGAITTLVDADLAAQFIGNWNGTGFPFQDEITDSARYAIIVKALDRNTVEMKGEKTGETVRLSTTYRGDRTYTSDKPGHAEHRYLAKPISCPNDLEPEWYRAFLNENQRVPMRAEKASSQAGKASKSAGKVIFHAGFPSSL
ncbi:MAG: hypothetical protein JWP91_846 [Fibrobacteres bacterium]|nr:hypothetical protein [Fibrobacterota bacterium]